LRYGGFAVEAMLGSHDGAPFDEQALHQLLVCRKAERPMSGEAERFTFNQRSART
jgi:hypothetical protein